MRKDDFVVTKETTGKGQLKIGNKFLSRLSTDGGVDETSFLKGLMNKEGWKKEKRKEG